LRRGALRQILPSPTAAIPVAAGEFAVVKRRRVVFSPQARRDLFAFHDWIAASESGLCGHVKGTETG
jgi:hypothetical protein